MRQPAKDLSNKDLCMRLVGIAAFHVEDSDAGMARSRGLLNDE